MTLREQLVVLERKACSKYYSSLFREAITALDERDELLHRAREIVNIAQLYMESGNEAPEEDWFMVDGWIRDYEAMTKETA